MSPKAVLSEVFPKSSVSKKALIITREDSKLIAADAKQKVSPGVIRAYVLTTDKKINGYAILLIKTVRTKDMATLYSIDNSGKVKHIQVLAFYEPHEYKPSTAWLDWFKLKSIKNSLKIGNDVTNLTGATLSAKAIADGARLALAIHQNKFMQK